MRTLRLTYPCSADPDRAEVLFEGDGQRHTAISRLRFQLTPQDQEDVRWYLEDYLQYPVEPAPALAAGVEQRLAALGVGLFDQLFPPGSDARSLWDGIRTRLGEIRVEIVTDPAGALIPWELLNDPAAAVPVARQVRAFVRAPPTAVDGGWLRQDPAAGIRILLVICRPGGADDVPFRSVASHLVRLSAEARAALDLDVLRPPTFAQLEQVLRAASHASRPYHVVHFDGHGVYVHRTSEPGPRGYLLFENPQARHNQEPVDGATLGRLLAETGVPVLVLNACRSAHAEIATQPQTVASDAAGRGTQVAAYGSLAQEVVGSGVAGVVAMRYNVYVVTAAQFIGNLYAALLEGQPLGEAVTLGRKQLAEQPFREIAFSPRPLQDWTVPVVYEATPLALFPTPPTDQQRLVVTVNQARAAEERARLGQHVPAGPDVGFYGRDETLLALDRAFDTHQVVLLHAFAGSGKTSTAAEFARWYRLTGGVDTPVLFTSFQRYMPLARVLDQLGVAFEAWVQTNKKRQWLTFDDTQRHQLAVEILEQVPVLWVWDNLEPVAGFPEGSASAWSAAEQGELAGFLHAVGHTKAKVLLTSRRAERGWLGGLPARVQLPSMPMAERVQLARAIAAKHGHELAEVEDWRPLLEYTQGNPLTVTVLVGQAFRDGLRTRAQVEDFVARLRAGEASLPDDEREGRTRSLGASLDYGFQHGFSEPERAQLALLHLFQGFVDVVWICMMGDLPPGEEAVAAVRGLNRDSGIALLDRAAEVGLLTALGGGCYAIHPALPPHFAKLFTRHHGRRDSPGATAARRAYASAIARSGESDHIQYAQGRAEVIDTLHANEANLLHALDLARRNGWWDEVMMAMQGLRVLYEHTGRWAEWEHLVRKLTPDLVDPATDQPLPGREQQWTLITDYRAALARRVQDRPAATRLQQARVAWNRQQAKAPLAADPASLDDIQRHQVRALAVSVHELAELLREQQLPGCVQAYTEALSLDRRIGDHQLEAITASNLAAAYLFVPGVRDLDQAERWIAHALDRYDPAERLRRGRSIHVVGEVYLNRFDDALATGRPHAELGRYLNAALHAYQQALGLYPSDAVGDLAATHYALGNIYQRAGQVDTALSHWRESIRYDEAAGNRYGAAQARYCVAWTLADRGRLEEARLWAQRALLDYEGYGQHAADQSAETRELIARIEQDMAGDET